jgi:hypothetical protein
MWARAAWAAFLFLFCEIADGAAANLHLVIGPSRNVEGIVAESRVTDQVYGPVGEAADNYNDLRAVQNLFLVPRRSHGGGGVAFRRCGGVGRGAPSNRLVPIASVFDPGPHCIPEWGFGIFARFGDRSFNVGGNWSNADPQIKSGRVPDILIGDENRWPFLAIDTRQKGYPEWGNPSPISRHERVFERFVRLVENARADNGRNDQKKRKNHEPSGEAINRQRLLEPPAAFLWRLLLFCSPGIACSVAGFVLFNGPHRRPSLGAALYFSGFAAIVFAAFLAL